ncbi:hydrogenase maturation protease [Billgrantia azerbaijanica]|nr:hydrogenase maturation protease [Halomonas azerbaijanica]
MTPTAPPRVLVVGLGNPDRGDDGVGVRVAQRLADRLPAGVGLLTARCDALALIDDWAGVDALVAIDAATPLGVPGRLHRLAPGSDIPEDAGAPLSGHALGLFEALALARTLHLPVPATVVVYAIEAGAFSPGAPLSPAVAAAVPTVVACVADEVARLCRDG